MIRTPPGWGADILSQAYRSVTTINADQLSRMSAPVTVRQLDFDDLRWALRRGIEDFAASRTDVIMLCVFYPLLGLLFARFASGHDLLPLIFPLASGFALIGPLAGVGLAEMSRRREMGQTASWADAFAVLRSPAIISIFLLGGILLGIFLFWLVLANAVYDVTLGPQPPLSASLFLQEVLHTTAGHAMAVVGIGAGFFFAVGAFAISVVSFPMLLDRNVTLETAIRTSVAVVASNPLTMAGWAAVIALALVIGSLPLLLGLIVVLPVLGHATWHLYRRAVG